MSGMGSSRAEAEDIEMMDAGMESESSMLMGASMDHSGTLNRSRTSTHSTCDVAVYRNRGYGDRTLAALSTLRRSAIPAPLSFDLIRICKCAIEKRSYQRALSV